MNANGLDFESITKYPGYVKVYDYWNGYYWDKIYLLYPFDPGELAFLYSTGND